MSILTDYANAYRAANGTDAVIEQCGDRFTITTASGSHDKFTAKDVRNAIRALKHIAGRKSA